MSQLPLKADARGYVHPRSEDELVAIVRYARSHGMTVRVCGAAHSVPAAIHTDRRLGSGDREAIEIMLDAYAGVTFDDAKRRVTVAGGCRFGFDPHDPTGRSTVESGLCHQLSQRGWALPNLPGVTHPTIAGFLSTGAAGASVRHRFADCVLAIRLVDGTGAVRELSRETDRDAFEAALVSMGLLGIVSTVTLQCEAHYDVIGSEVVTTVARAPFDMFKEGPKDVATFLRDTEYARILWWPQRGVDKLAIWTARRMQTADYDDDTGPAWALTRKPYHAFDPIFGTTLPLQAAAGASLAVIGGWQKALEERAGPLLGGLAQTIASRPLLQRLKAGVFNVFVPEDRASRPFWDTWWRGLAMDDAIDERFLPTTFTEVWLPLSSAAEALRRLRDLFAADPDAAGNFVVEIYASGPTEGWLSPSQGQASVRLNFFWLLRNRDDPRDAHFPKLWSALADLGPRFHWAKLLPHDTPSAEVLATLYPRYADFVRLRSEYDPDGVFLTSYWRAHLAIDRDAAVRPKAPLPGTRRNTTVAAPGHFKWPLLFEFGSADASLFETASHLIDARRHIPAPIEEVARIMWFEVTSDWLVAHVGLDWLTERDVPKDAIVDMTFSFMTMRGKVIDLDWPRRWAAHITAASLPLATSMIEGVELEPAADGGTDVRWRIAYDVAPALAPMNVLVKPFFQWMFERSLENLGRYVERPGSVPSKPKRTGASISMREGA